MHLIDWILFGLIVIAFLWAICQVRKKKGSCGGNCSTCEKRCKM